MLTTFISSSALGLLAVLAPPPPPPPTQEPGASHDGGGLRRLEPSAEAEDPNRLEDLFARDFERGLWQKRLAEPDLERREASFEALLRRARLDPIARAFLEELARDPAGGELAWTARLALRELGRARFPLHGLPGSSPFDLEPLVDDPLGGMQRMQGLLNELFAQGAIGRVPPHSAPRVPGGRGRSVELEQGDGEVVLRITTRVDGQESTRSYEAASLAELLASHPELNEELGGLSLPFGRAPLLRRFPGQVEPGIPLVPQGRSRPVLTDRLGVVVQPLDSVRARELGLTQGGLLVERTVPESYAQLLGVGMGAVLLELDGEPLRTGEDIERRMRSRGADDPLELVWLDELGQRQAKTWRAPESGTKR